MILYNYGREVITDFINYNPRSCFIITQLGEPWPDPLVDIRKYLTIELEKRSLIEFDANSYNKAKTF
jgi:hypothetical protein